MAKRKNDTTSEVVEQAAIAAKAEAERLAEKKEKGHSPVSKASRGIDSTLKTTWVDFNCTKEDHRTLTVVATAKNVNLATFLSKMFIKAVKDDWDTLVALANEYQPASAATTKPLEEMTIEELEAFIAREQKRAETIQNNLEAARRVANKTE